MIILSGCSDEKKTGNPVEQQLTTASYGHFLNPVQSFSGDGNWLVYDTRNADPDIGRTGRIERIHIRSGEVDTVYETRNQSEYGPGVGAVAYSPVEDRIIFIHGIRNADEHQPYGITRRSGMGIWFDQQNKLVHYDARDIQPPYTPGALRGGSHAHSWSGDGKWISFTYNDEVMAKISRHDPVVQDLRMVGVMAPWSGVEVAEADGVENFSGELFSMVVTRVTESPYPGSDEISKAYEDGWIGRNGYIDAKGVHHPKAIAFLGDVQDGKGHKVTEVFVVDLPDEMPDLTEEPQLTGEDRSRPQQLSMVRQRRVTFTVDRKHPGVQGPRQWMKSAPDGSELYFMMKDEGGAVQIFSVPTIGGEISQRTFNDFSIETAFDVAPDGRGLAYGSGEKIYYTDIPTGETTCLTPEVPDHYSELRAIQWAPSGKMLTYNRKVFRENTAYFQIFILTL